MPRWQVTLVKIAALLIMALSLLPVAAALVRCSGLVGEH